MDGITLRPVQKKDEQLLFRIYASSRSDLEWVTGIDEKMRDGLVHGQYILEQAYINTEYPDADFNIVLYKGEPVGRLYVFRNKAFIRIIAISILPEYRSKGIGGAILSDVLDEASYSGKYVCLNVMWYNYLARSLYEKLGFIVAEDAGVSCEMHWTPVVL